MQTKQRRIHIKHRALAAPLLVALLGSASPLVAAHEAHHHHATPAASTPSWEERTIEVPDVPVTNQHGEQKRFFSDLVEGRTVAINFMYTSCSAVCSPMTATLSQVQRDLMARDSKVELVSVSVDPVTDRPPVLKEFAQRFAVKSGWNFVTGESADIAKLIDAFGLRGKKEDHTPIIFISNGATGKWTLTLGLASAKSIFETIVEAAGLGGAPTPAATASGEAAPGNPSARQAEQTLHAHHS